MDGKLNYPRFHLCKTPDKKTPIRREMTFFAKVSKIAFFCKMANGVPRQNVQKWPIFLTNFGRQKNRKYKSYHSLISMDGKLNYRRFHLCKNPDEKTPIRGEMTFFAKVSKTAVFCKMAKGRPRQNVQTWPIF